MGDAQKGDFVQIHKIILGPDQRPDSIPSSTKSVNYEGWIKGFLLDENAAIGDAVRIETFIGREVSGILCQLNPAYDHSFGVPQREILSIGKEARDHLEES